MWFWKFFAHMMLQIIPFSRAFLEEKFQADFNRTKLQPNRLEYVLSFSRPVCSEWINFKIEWNFLKEIEFFFKLIFSENRLSTLMNFKTALFITNIERKRNRKMREKYQLFFRTSLIVFDQSRDGIFHHMHTCLRPLKILNINFWKDCR